LLIFSTQKNLSCINFNRRIPFLFNFQVFFLQRFTVQYSTTLKQWACTSLFNYLKNRGKKAFQLKKKNKKHFYRCVLVLATLLFFTFPLKFSGKKTLCYHGNMIT
jgi:hypothetical protein